MRLDSSRQNSPNTIANVCVAFLSFLADGFSFRNLSFDMELPPFLDPDAAAAAAADFFFSFLNLRQVTKENSFLPDLTSFLR